MDQKESPDPTETSPERWGRLRRQAEKAAAVRVFDYAGSEDPRQLLEELRVHQIQLEMQNEELRQTHEMLKEAHDRYAALYDFAPVGYFVLAEAGLILAANLTGAGQVGVERGTLEGQPFARFILPADQDVFYFFRRNLFRHESRQTCELRLLRPDSSVLPVRLEGDRVAGGPVEGVRLRLAVIDISERGQIEQALAAGAEVSQRLAAILDWDELLEKTVSLIRQTFDYDLVCLYLLDPDSGLPVRRAAAGFIKMDLTLSANESLAVEAMERGEVVMTPSLDEGHGGRPVLSGATLAAPLKVGGQTSGVLLVAQRPGREFTGRDRLAMSALSAFVATALQNARLVADLKQTQDQLVQSEWLAALGQMAATVAHELRNPLMGVRLGVEYLTRDLAPHDPRQRGIILLHSNVERINRIVEDILFIGRVPLPSFQAESLQVILERELERWQPVFTAKKIKVRRDFADALPPLPIDADQLGRAISNLLGNSADALPPGGDLHLGLTAGDGGQVVTVADNGPGIPPDQLPHLFEPFFTTKSRGTGLGLSIVKHIVELHGGRVHVLSEIGKGTSFTISLPAVKS